MHSGDSLNASSALQALDTIVPDQAAELLCAADDSAAKISAAMQSERYLADEQILVAIMNAT